jgi:hypothetical protein
MDKKITFVTQCFEGDWKKIILEGGFEKKSNKINFKFYKKILIVTNVNNRVVVEQHIQKLIKDNIIDEYYFTDDYSKEVLDNFEISTESFNGGYWYSIAPLTAIFKTDGDYMLYLTGDTTIESKNVEWLQEGISLMELNEKIKVANPVWNHDINSLVDEEKVLDGEVNPSNDDWSYGRGFSDQCFLIPINTFKGKIYNETNEISNKYYPYYGGESFEKRVGAFLRNNSYYRITNKKISYLHPNYN